MFILINVDNLYNLTHILLIKNMIQKSRKLFRLLPNETVFLECDIQEKFRKHIQNFNSVVHNAKRLA